MRLRSLMMTSFMSCENSRASRARAAVSREDVRSECRKRMWAVEVNAGRGGGGGAVEVEDAERESWDIRNDESHGWEMYVR